MDIPPVYAASREIGHGPVVGRKHVCLTVGTNGVYHLGASHVRPSVPDSTALRRRSLHLREVEACGLRASSAKQSRKDCFGVFRLSGVAN